MERTIRAYHGHLATTLAMTTFSRPGPIMPTMARIMTSLGKDIITSHMRISTSSIRLRKKPETRPTHAPNAAVMAIVSKDRNTVARMP